MCTATTTLPQTLRLSNADDPLLSLRAASERGWPHPHTLRRYVHDGRLPAVKVGKQFMVRESDLDRLAAPVLAMSDLVEAHPSEPNTLDDLAVMAAQMVTTWPRLSVERKAELSRLLAAS
ncbi:helix-turn-helix domain-containing protein [Microterricola pindariensis]|uniref:Helix-turn-helix domain-containing protein n=1 Tax=Microterricola pindariensis TaxID=478010 RepID=A0ABX5AZC9_9MICO|nr:helix-turn-helix domain-containing protein [Microterricola pindariensis]PPL19808.1 hypothetical protein GY24_04105 [Microterricola pindariensis]